MHSEDALLDFQQETPPLVHLAEFIDGGMNVFVYE